MYALSTLTLSVIFIEIFTVSRVVADFVLSLILLTSITGVSESAFVLLTDASIFIGQVKHLEFDLIRNQSH